MIKYNGRQEINSFCASRAKRNAKNDNKMENPKGMQVILIEEGRLRIWFDWFKHYLYKQTYMIVWVMLAVFQKGPMLCYDLPAVLLRLRMNPPRADLNRLSHRRCNRSNHRLGFKSILRTDICRLCWRSWVYSCWCWCASDLRGRRIACRCKTWCEALSEDCLQAHYSIINPLLSLYRCSQNRNRNRY